MTRRACSENRLTARCEVKLAVRDGSVAGEFTGQERALAIGFAPSERTGGRACRSSVELERFAGVGIGAIDTKNPRAKRRRQGRQRRATFVVTGARRSD